MSGERFRRRGLLGCTLCWRVTLAVFISILVIEAAILIPSYRNYERDQLKAIALAGENVVQALINDAAMGRMASMDELEGLIFGTYLVGGEFRRPDGELITRFGEPLAGLHDPGSIRASRLGDRLEVVYSPELLQRPYEVAARLDASRVGDALIAFVWRILGLVLLIAGFVTVVTMVVLDRLVLAPVVGLRNRLRAAGDDPDHPLDYRVGSRRGDEFGQVERAFDAMLGRSAENLEALHAREEELKQHNVLLDQRVAERTRALTETNAALRREIEQRQQTEAQIEILARFPDENTSPVLRVSGDGELLYANAASAPLLSLWGTSPGERLPAAWAEVVAAVLKGDGACKNTEIAVGERHYALQFTPVASAGYANVYATDVTDRKRFEDELRRAGSHDRLTGLANLTSFTDRVDQAVRLQAQRGRELAVLLLDLDNFKEINAVVGHGGGDEVLREAARRIEAVLNPADSAGRIGGDVFGILLADCEDADAAAALADRLVRALAEPFDLDGRELTGGAGIGIALFPADGSGAEELIRNADLALYRAKNEGPNRYEFFVSGMNEAAEQRQRLVRELDRAVTQNQFELHYQPQLALADGRLVGVEALIRWRHPRDGLVPPGVFIPVAESTGLIVPMGDWVLREACAQARRWQQAGLPRVRVAVNLSALQLQQPDLVERVAAVLAETGLPGEALELEITESLMMKDVEGTIEKLGRLNALGVLLSVDDFGTGYSSLAYLQRLPIHKIKIDRSFVMNIAEDPHSLSISRAIIQLSRGLRLQVIAEGVETEAQAEVLRGLDCDEVQGYLFGKPMPAAEVERYLQQPAPTTLPGW